MAKSSNPADAHRKQLRKKELKKNKDDRKKTREISTVKKDTRPIENGIKRLSQAAQKGPLSPEDKAELASLREELAKINKAKTDYVELHPEHRKFVFPERKPDPSTSAAREEDGPGLYTRDGKLKDPQRSFYYDPVFNPFGAPPPGMPYTERLPTAEEIEALNEFMRIKPAVEDEEEEEEEDSDDDEDDDDIALPPGPPPPPSDSDSSSEDEDDDDIQMPSGPPPPKSIPTKPSKPNSIISRPSIPLPPTPRFPQQHNPFPNQHPFPPQQQQQNHNPNFFPLPQHQHQLPHRPLPNPINDPLAPSSHLPPKPIFQSLQHPHHQQQHQYPPSPFPQPSTSSFPPATSSSSATISAEPNLRDLKKEATAFLPSTMRKKKPTPASAASAIGVINAAPNADGGSGGGEERASLKDALKGVGIGKVEMKRRDKGREDYELFEKSMSGFLK